MEKILEIKYLKVLLTLDKESRILAPKISIRASVFRQPFSMVQVYRKAEPISSMKNVAPISRSIPFLSTISLGFRIAFQSLKTATVAVSGNQAFVADWEQTA